MWKGKVSREMDEELTIWKPRTEPRFEFTMPKKGHGIQIRKFFRQNPEIVIRVLIVFFTILTIASCAATKHRTTERLTAQFREELSAATFRVEQETINRMKEEYGINAANAEKMVMEEEAKVVAKVLYAMRDNRESGLHLACWAIFDRVDHVRYSDDLYSVCSADQAFMGWSDGNPVLDHLYNIALEEVQRWHRGIRPLDTAFVYLYWTPSEIYLFDDFGHRYYESDWAKYIDSIAE